MESISIINNQLTDLKLSGIHSALPTRMKQAREEDLGYEGFLSLILQDEMDFRKSNRVIRLLKRASFKQNASLETIDFSFPRDLDKKLIKDLATCQFIRDGINLVISGPTGVGKSFLATAFGNNACRNGITSAFFKMNTLIEQTLLSRAKGTYLNLLKRLYSFDLLVLDDFGIKPLEPQQYQDLYDVIDDRSVNKSTIITTQVPVKNWGEIIPDPVTCEAVTDRLISKAIKIQMKGPTYRPETIKKIKTKLDKD